MEYQILSKKFKFNINKNIGSVLYIVEGEKTEIKLLGHIFKSILNYEKVVSVDRRGKQRIKYVSGTNKNSKVFICNSKESNIRTMTDTQFVNKQVDILKEYEDEFNYEDIPIYYIFDCDRKEDKPYISGLIENYTNSREPGANNKFDSIGGMLLLSYPSIESFIISNFESDMFKASERCNFKNQTIKEYIGSKGYNYSNMSIQTLNNSFMELIKSLEKIRINKIEIDDTREFNNEIYEYEQLHDNQYMLSLLLISFIDLGIIEFEE